MSFPGQRDVHPVVRCAILTPSRVCNPDWPAFAASESFQPQTLAGLAAPPRQAGQVAAAPATILPANPTRCDHAFRSSRLVCACPAHTGHPEPNCRCKSVKQVRLPYKSTGPRGLAGRARWLGRRPPQLDPTPFAQAAALACAVAHPPNHSGETACSEP